MNRYQDFRFKKVPFNIIYNGNRYFLKKRSSTKAALTKVVPKIIKDAEKDAATAGNFKSFKVLHLIYNNNIKPLPWVLYLCYKYEHKSMDF